MNKLFTALTITLLSFTLMACANNVSPNTYSASDVGKVNRAEHGVIIAKRAITIDNNSGYGGLAGATAGAAAGSSVGGSGAANIVGAVGGAVVGGLFGNAIDKNVHRQQGFEYIIKLKNGKTTSVAQAQGTEFQVKQRVIVVYGRMARIIPDAS
jgi:outer membrane lipoprotein SlyB